MTVGRLAGKNVLVTGGAGFIGSHLVTALAREGAASLVVVDDLSLGRRENLASAEDGGAPLRFHEADASDHGTMASIIERERVDVAFDLAVRPLPESLETPGTVVATNIACTLALCELLRHRQYKTLIHFSSSEAYGTAELIPMAEAHPLAPRTPYASSKAAGDHIVLSYCRTFGIDAAIVRPFNNYGPRQNTGGYAGVIPIVVGQALRGEAVTIFGDGEQTRDFIFVEDTVEAVIRIYAERRTRGRVVNVGSGTETRIRDLIRLILEIVRADVPVHHAAERPGDVRRHCAGMALARELIGFAPSVSLRDGLERTIAWYAASGLVWP